MMKEITGGVCAATGFTASGLRCGVKANARPDRKDLALIYSEKPCSAAGMFTTVMRLLRRHRRIPPTGLVRQLLAAWSWSM